MDLSTVLIKIAGVVLLIWTLYSIYRHVRERQKTIRSAKPGETQSVSEQILNNILLYLWLAFMIVFSIGMVVTN
jgi:threonine/homoserine/homoserine lactone efflux protein